MNGDKIIDTMLNIFEKIVTVVGWVAIILGLFFFSVPEKGFF